jgi:ATP-dependent Clp protease ATP-binding subunit ClpX
VSSTGYKGANLVDIFNDIVPQRSHRNFDRSVILIDEIDKAANTTVGTSSGFGPTLQNELIAWTESAKVQIGSDRQQQLLIDTKDMLFIGAGAFVGIAEIVAKRLGRKRTLGFVNNTAAPDTEELLDRLSPEDLENYGLKPELIARFPVLTYTKQLPPDAIISIMKTGRKSSFLQQIALLRDGYNTDITFDEEVYHILADAVAHQKRGARGIETVTQKLFAEIKHDMRSAKNRTALHITPADALGRLANLLPAGYKR